MGSEMCIRDSADTLIWIAFPAALAAALVLMRMVAKRQLNSME